MKFNFNISLWAIVALVVVICALIYVNRTRVQAHRATINALDSASIAFESYRSTSEATVSEQAAIILSQDDALAMGILDADKLKELNLRSIEVNIKLTERIQALEKEGEFIGQPSVVYRDTSYGDVDTTIKYMEIPVGIRYEDQWVNLHATVDYPTPIFDTVGFLSKPEITIGWQKQGFLKKPERTVFYTNENPYVTVIDMRNVVIEEPKKWWQTDVAKVGGGIIAFEILRNLLISK